MYEGYSKNCQGNSINNLFIIRKIVFLLDWIYLWISNFLKLKITRYTSDFKNIESPYIKGKEKASQMCLL